MMKTLPNGSRVMLLDPASFYCGQIGFVRDHADARHLGGKLAYTVVIQRDQGQVSLAASADNLKLVDDAEMDRIRAHAAKMQQAAAAFDAEFGKAVA